MFVQVRYATRERKEKSLGLDRVEGGWGGRKKIHKAWLLLALTPRTAVGGPASVLVILETSNGILKNNLFDV